MRYLSKASLLLLTLLLLGLVEAQAQTIGTCTRSLGEAYLDINNVRARILNTGGLFYRGEPHVYEVPKGGASNVFYASGIWLAGEVGGQLRASASRYGEWEFWAGPLDENGNPPADCAVYDRLYKVSRRDVYDYENTGAATPDLRDWPTGLGAPTLAAPDNGIDDDQDGEIDEEGEQIYVLDQPLNARKDRVIDLAGGERPALIGDQSIWWIMNDRGNMHTSTDAPPIGVEVHAMAFARATDDDLNNTTFYQYTLFYKGDAPFENAYFGIFSDPDLGDFSDDYVGSDTLLGLGYVYNADNEDTGDEGYGTPPPAAGYDFVQGPIVPSIGDTARVSGINVPDFKNLGMSRFVFYNGGGCVTCDPATGEEYYNYLRGRWRDGQRITFGGNGRSFSQIPVNFVFPGDPVTGEGWSEVNPAGDGSRPPIDPADRRFVMSSGPFTLNPGDRQEVVFGIVWAIGVDHLASVDALRQADARIQAAFDQGIDTFPSSTEPPTTPAALASPADGTSGQPTNPTLYWHALPGIALYQIQLATEATFSADISRHERPTPSISLTGFAPDTTYFWRVRAANPAGFGPWSAVWHFSTADAALRDDGSIVKGFAAVANKAGLITPPDMAAFAFNSSGFPVLEQTGVTPPGSYPDADRPTRGVQQSSNNAAWGIHTGESGQISFDTWLARTFTDRGRTVIGSLGLNDYEWRFTQRCLDDPPRCIAWRRFEDDLPMQVPFELWNVGPTDDPSDDFQMIPAICEEACEAGTEPFKFDIGGDHDISSGDDDPYTDWVYWFNPVDTSPGEAGYRAFAVAPGSSSPALGGEVMGRTVLVNWNGWIDTDGDGLYDAVSASLPEPGTVFRIITGALQAPFLASPADGATVTPPAVTFYWQANFVDEHFQLQLATDSTFNDLIEETVGLTDRVYTFAGLAANTTYFWRVRNSNMNGEGLSPWSDTWRFSTGIAVAVEAIDGAVPETFSLEANYPNPFNPTTTFSFGLSEATRVRLEVYDVLGRVVARLVDGPLPAGVHRATWEAHDKASGVYFYRLTAASFSQTRVMVLVR